MLRRRWICFLLALFAGGCERSDRTTPVSAPTFTKDVAPIIFKHCVPCHRTGQPVPFTLARFDDVKTRADAIARATRERRMPPWLPEPSTPSFIGERRLDANEIAILQRWADSGALEGDARSLPPLPAFPQGWEFGQPDLIATMPRPYVLRPGGHDVYRNVVLRLPLTESKFVRAVEFRPGTASVHHAVIRIDRTHASRAHDGADGQPGFDGMVAYDVQDPAGQFLGWAPGRGPILAPEGMPWRLERGSDLVVEMHLMTGRDPKDVHPAVGLFFTSTPPAKEPVMLVMASKAIDIPDGEARYTIEDQYQLPVDIDLLSVYPHAHYLAREMRVTARLPDGNTRSLLHIRQWNFQWQQDYRFTTPVPLPRGTTISMQYSYDNSETNGQNPHRPLRRVTWGPQSSDEMGNLGVQVLPRTKADADTLVRSFATHAAMIDIRGAEMLVKAFPTDASHAAFLGTSYVRVGRYSDAIPHLERALRLDPRSVNAANYLGGALLAMGRTEQALAYFRRASALAPRDEHLHFNVARVLEGAGHASEAKREYQRALALNPEFGEAHHQLGVLFFSTNQLRDALTHLQQAAHLLPGSAVAHNDLGGALAQSGRFDDALRHVERALQIDPTYEAARDNRDRLRRVKR